MAQASEIARGKARYEESDLERRTQQFTTRDHSGDEVAVSWDPSAWTNPDEDLPPFPFQVYILSTAESVANDAAFPRKLAAFVHLHWGSKVMCRFHFQVYRRPFPNILACIAHQRREIHYRNRNGIVPRMLEEWAEDEEYKGRILVIDRDGWEREGIVFASFDPVEHENRSQFSAWNIAAIGDFDIVKASRAKHTSAATSILRHWYVWAGGPNTEDFLQRRNDGGISPVLYPAIDPAAHYDVEHEDVHELDSTEIPGPAMLVDENDQDNGNPRIINTFDPSELFLREEELNCYQSETYSDHFGLPITSIWNTDFSRTRPPFSFTLYVAFDFLDKLQIHPKALFRCLDKGLIAREAWTLDIVTNMPSLDAAFQYHARASADRAPEKARRRRECARLLVQKTSGSRLPGEILEYIEDLLAPPQIFNYSERPRRPFQDFMLYLDKSRKYNGPLMIYSNPDGSWRKATSTLSEHLARGEPYNHPDCILRVVHQRYWHRVADELHVLWSLCSPRRLPDDNPTIPRAHLWLRAPEACVDHASFGTQYINGYPDLTLEFCSDGNVVLPADAFRRLDSSMFSHDLWDECIAIIDLETGAVLSPVPARIEDTAICFDSWAKTRDLGFGPGPDQALHPRFWFFEPNVPTKLMLRPSQEWWQHNVRNGTFKSGREYAFKLKAGFNIPRWTYGSRPEKDGSKPNIHGPFNLPPIPVTVDETPQPFKFRVESIGAPHGSFNR